MNGCNQSPVRLPKMHRQKSLTLHRRSFSEWGSDHVIYSFPKKVCHYVGYGQHRPSHFAFTVHTRQKIVDALLTLIFRIGHGACCYYFWLERQPIPRLWMAAIICHLGYTRRTAKNCWCSVDAHFQNGAVTVSFTLLPRNVDSTLVMDSSDRVTFQLQYIHDQKLLTLHWCSFSVWGRERDAIVFDLKGSQYPVYEWLQPIATKVIQDAQPKIVDTPLALIFRMGSDHVVYSFAKKGCH